METTKPVQLSRHIHRPARYICISIDQAGRRIDNFLSSQLGDVPKSRIYRMLRRGEVRVNGKRVRQGYKLQAGEQVRIPPLLRQQQAATGQPQAYLLQKIDNCELYEDADLLAINKPAGLAVHSGSGRTFGVIELLRLVRADESLQLVHRLDRETSGVLLIARSHRYLTFLQDCLQRGLIIKRYQALLNGCLDREEITVTSSLSRNFLRSGERLSAVDADGKTAHTRFRLIRDLGGACLVDVRIKTGRTHQIRAHAASIGHAVAGDDKYGDKSFNKHLKSAGLKRLFLHACALQIPAYGGAGEILVEAPLPPDLHTVLQNYPAARRPGSARVR